MKKILMAGILSCSLLVSGLTGGQKAEASSSDVIADTALDYVGVPYVWGGTTPSGFDCSGFINYTYNKAGISLPRTTSDMYQKGQAVSKSALKEGDLVFFTTYKAGPSHAGIYLGNGKFVHAGDSGVQVAALSNPYWTKTYYGSKRVLSTPTGWKLEGGNWYFYKENGSKQTGWLKWNNQWYFHNQTGVMETGWVRSNGLWYFLNKDGAMETGWVYTGGKWYFLYSNGSMAYNTIIGGYQLDGSGAWIQ